MVDSHSLRVIMDAEASGFRQAANKATTDSTERLKSAARSEVASGLPGRGAARASRAVRSRLYRDAPGGGGETVSGIVYSRLGRKEAGRFVDYLGLHMLGGTVKPKGGRYLYIPLPGAGRKADTLRSIIGVKGVRLVPLKGNRYLIVRGSRTRDILIGLLVPRVRIPKRLDFDRLIATEQSRLLQNVGAGIGDA